MGDELVTEGANFAIEDEAFDVEMGCSELKEVSLLHLLVRAAIDTDAELTIVMPGES